MRKRKIVFTACALVVVCICICCFAITVEAAQAKALKRPVTNLPNPQEDGQDQTEISVVSGNGTIRIRCPLKTARTEITTPLPEGWWNTPQEGRLMGTSIQTISGEKSMVCSYWAYDLPRGVGIGHLFPEGVSDCKAVKGGFVCYPQGGASGITGSQTTLPPIRRMEPITRTVASLNATQSGVSSEATVEQSGNTVSGSNTQSKVRACRLYLMAGDQLIDWSLVEQTARSVPGVRGVEAGRQDNSLTITLSEGFADALSEVRSRLGAQGITVAAVQPIPIKKSAKKSVR
jgi:hypothetical protein